MRHASAGTMRRVLGWLEGQAAAGVALIPGNHKIGAELGMTDSSVTGALRVAAEQGLVRVFYPHPQRRVVEAADGAWRLVGRGPGGPNRRRGDTHA